VFLETFIWPFLLPLASDPPKELFLLWAGRILPLQCFGLAAKSRTGNTLKLSAVGFVKVRVQPPMARFFEQTASGLANLCSINTALNFNPLQSGSLTPLDSEPIEPGLPKSGGTIFSRSFGELAVNFRGRI
jgi:hypothetical protein